MKRIHSLMIAALATTILCGESLGDDLLDGIGKGKLLRKWRDDLFGKSDDDKPAQPNAENPRQQPTLAQPRPAMGMQQQYPQPAQAYRNQPAQRGQQLPSGAAAPANVNPRSGSYFQPESARTQQPNINRAAPTASSAAARPPIVQPPTNSPAVDGFGMEVRAGKDDNFYILQIDPRGNAAKAGVQRGDKIVEIGGAKITNLNELTEISKVLGEGDQLEFLLSRGGQEKKIMIQFGEAQPLPSPQELELTPVNSGVSNPAARDLGRSTTGPAVTGRYDFVPQPSANGYQSVLDIGTRQSGAVPARSSQRNRRDENSNLSGSPNQLVSHQKPTRESIHAELDRQLQSNGNLELDATEFGSSILVNPMAGAGK